MTFQLSWGRLSLAAVVPLLALGCVGASEEFEYFYAMYDQPWTHPADRFWSYPQLAELGFHAIYAPGRASSDMDLWLDIWANGSLELSLIHI